VVDPNRGFNLRLRKKDATKFLKAIAAFLPAESLRYKSPYSEILEEPNPGLRVELGSPAVVSDLRGSWNTDLVFDLEVLDNHNYYANGVAVHNCCEILHEARIHGGDQAKTLTKERQEKLVVAVRDIVTTACERDDRDWWKVFRKKTCGTCGGKITREPWGVRGHYCCHQCQPVPTGFTPPGDPRRKKT